MVTAAMLPPVQFNHLQTRAPSCGVWFLNQL
jgi:hypothetical protein